MSPLAGPLFALAALLAGAGVVKLARPEAGVAALRTAGLPHPAAGVQALGAAEVILAVWAIAFGGRAAAGAIAAVYAGFAWFTDRLVRRSEATASCGCFGVDASSPATRWHVGVNVVAALTALAAVVWPAPGLLDVLADQPLAGVPFLALTGLATWMLLALYTLLPDLVDAAAEVRADSEAAST